MQKLTCIITALASIWHTDFFLIILYCFFLYCLYLSFYTPWKHQISKLTIKIPKRRHDMVLVLLLTLRFSNVFRGYNGLRFKNKKGLSKMIISKWTPSYFLPIKKMLALAFFMKFRRNKKKLKTFFIKKDNSSLIIKKAIFRYRSSIEYVRKMFPKNWHSSDMYTYKT